MRRKRGDDEANLDSLLDTLFNVVGILVIMLVVILLGMDEAVSRITEAAFEENLPEVSEAQLQQKIAEQYQLAQYLAQLQQQPLNRPDDSEVNRSKSQIQALIEQLKKELASLDDYNVNLPELQTKLKQLEDELKRLRTDHTKAEDEVERLEGLLDQTPVQAAVEPKIVNLPNPRPAPEGVEPTIFFCRYGRVIQLDEERLMKLASSRTRSIKLRDIPAGKDNLGGKDVSPWVQLFEKAVVGSPFVRLKLKPIGRYLYMEFQMNKDKGDDAKRVLDNNSVIARAVRAASIKKGWARVYVWPDSYDVYLAFRQVTEKHNLPAGWIPQYTTAEYRVRVPNIVLDVPRPKPRPKPATPPSNQPPVKKRPVPTDQID